MEFTQISLSHVFPLICSIGGSFFTASGLISMKIGNIRVEDKPDKIAFLQPWWIFGVFLLILSLVFNGGKCKYLWSYLLSRPRIWKCDSDFIDHLFFNNVHGNAFAYSAWRKVLLENWWSNYRIYHHRNNICGDIET